MTTIPAPSAWKILPDFGHLQPQRFCGKPGLGGEFTRKNNTETLFLPVSKSAHQACPAAPREYKFGHCVTGGSAGPATQVG
jgi:hypothetical protein